MAVRCSADRCNSKQKIVHSNGNVRTSDLSEPEKQSKTLEVRLLVLVASHLFVCCELDQHVHWSCYASAIGHVETLQHQCNVGLLVELEAFAQLCAIGDKAKEG